jgi:hypothetical protein
MKTEDEVSQFWSEIEKEHQGKVRFRTYAILLGKSSDTPLHISGLLYIIDNQVVFENFEKKQGGFFFLARKEKFEKFKMSFAAEDVLNAKEVTNRTAHRCIHGFMNHSETVPIRPYQGFLSKSICQVQFRSDYSLFFDLLDSKSFISYFKK